VQEALNYINNNYPRSPSFYIYGIAMQTYFGGPGATGDPGTETYTVQQILDGCHASVTGQIAGDSGRQAWINTAVNWSLQGGCCSYEGGTGFGGGSTTNIANRIMAVRNSGMKDELMYNYDDGFFALGGNLAMDLSLASAYTRYGCWGLTDDVADPDRNYQFQAARELLGYEEGDLNQDSLVNETDVGLFIPQWLDTGGCADPNCADIDGSGTVDFADFAAMANNYGY
jgi:hypothetical protein